MRGTIFNIQHFCTDDGPGIRTTVFFQGCNLRCFWCHNPESQSPQPQLQVFEALCLGCGKCVSVCPSGAQVFAPQGRRFLRERCTSCGKCTNSCPPGALTLAGKVLTTDEVMVQIDNDEAFYRNSGGGVSFSGGEPLLQRDFLKELLTRCAERGYHTAVESALQIPTEDLAQVVPLTSLFLADLKLMDSSRHLSAIGATNSRILENIRFLAQNAKALVIRVPVIPGVNTDPAQMEAMAEFLAGIEGIQAVEFMPYHGMAAEKYRSLGRVYEWAALEPPTERQLEEITGIFQCKNISVLK